MAKSKKVAAPTEIENKQKLHKIIYAIVFTEGAAVMAIELAGVKMIAPMFGTTLYVWAAVLSVTLGGLALGYFLGGRVANKHSGTKSIPVVLLLGGALIAIMPFTSLLAMQSTSAFGIRTASLLSSLLFLMPPLTCMGMVSPIVIQFGTQEANKAGKLAGTVYALSTVGGILMTLLMAFYFLPEWGIKSSVALVSFLIGGLGILSFIVLRNFKSAGVYGVLFLFLFVNMNTKKARDSSTIATLHQSEGILGQVTVFDYTDEKDRLMRTLLINGVPQTFLNVAHKPYSAWPYIHRIATIASTKPKGSKALLVGMAGGTLAMELSGMGFQTDIVELDERMPEIAEDYFGFKPEGIKIIIDDGRHYFNTSTTLYDLIIIDVLNGEEQPYQLFTQQAIKNLKRIVAPEGLVIVNFQGYLEGKNGLAGRSILKTLDQAGFNLEYFMSKGTIDEEGNHDGDIHFLASVGPIEIDEINHDRLNVCCQVFNYQPNQLITDKSIDYTDAFVLDDDQPMLEKLNVYWTEEWRKRKLADYKEQLLKYDFPVFN